MASVAYPQRIPVKVMLSVAADAVAPSPRSWGGERVGVRGKVVELASAPHPTPLPVKNGEREQTEYVALLVTSHWNVL
jgi:hypothetical protein